jgi:hypothetical protein
MALITETPSPTASASLAATASPTAREDQSVAACCTIAAAVSAADAYCVPIPALARGRGRGHRACRRAICHPSRRAGACIRTLTKRPRVCVAKQCLTSGRARRLSCYCGAASGLLAVRLGVLGSNTDAVLVAVPALLGE